MSRRDDSDTARNRLRRAGFVPFSKAHVGQSIPDRFEERARAHPERLAVRSRGESLSYGALNELSNRVAHAVLAARGDREETVALLLSPGATLVAALLGVLKAGKAYLALEPADPAADLSRTVAACRPSLLLTEDATARLADDLAAASIPRITLESLAPDLSTEDPGLGLHPDRLAYVFSTSGSTGDPKAVIDTHRNVLHNVMRYTNNLSIDADDRLSLIQSFSFSGTVSSLFSALLNGAAVFPFDLRSQGVERMAEWLGRERITVFHSVPSIFEMLARTGKAFPFLRCVRLEGDQALHRHVDLFQSGFAPDCVLAVGLGATETGLVRQYFVSPGTPMEEETVPIGYPVEDMEIRLLDEDGNEVPTGSVGEITVRSAYLARGYLGRPDLTEASFSTDASDERSRVYRTGDLGRLSADGCLEFLGRSRHEVKLRGVRVEVAPIENALAAVDGLRQALVVSREDRGGAQRLIAYLVPSADPRPTVSSLRRHLARQIPFAPLPSRYVFLDQLPKDRHGKLDRSALPDPDAARPVLDQPFVPPRTPREREIARCMSRILGVDDVGLHDDFWELGGDSLMAAELLVSIEERLGVTCPSSFLVGRASVESIRAGLEQEPSDPVVQLRPGDGRSPLFFVPDQRGLNVQYRQLAQLLAPDRAVYALPGRRGFRKRGFALPASTRTLARACVEAMRTVRSRGPYYLCGQCYGGTIAFEMARQLRSDGDEVGLLVLVDTRFPETVGERVRRALSLRHVLRRLRRISRREGRADVYDRLRDVEAWGPELTYRPRRYPGKVALITPGPPGQMLGWQDVAASLEVIELPPTEAAHGRPHLTSNVHVAALAHEMRGLLDRALRAEGVSTAPARVPQK